MTSLRKRSLIRPRHAFWLAAAMGMLILLACHTMPLAAIAQEHELMADDIPGIAAGHRPDEAAIARGGAVRVRRIQAVIADDGAVQGQVVLMRRGGRQAVIQIEPLIFGNGNDPAKNRLQFEIELKSKIEKLDEACGLSDAQKETLHLAGTGDIKRFFDDVETVRDEIEDADHNAREFENVIQKLAPLRARQRNDVIGPRSLYGKAVKRILTADQQARLAESVKNRWKPEFRRLVNNALKDLDRRANWDDDERRELVNLIVETARPPGNSGKFDYYVVWYYIAKLPEEKIKPYFQDRHWKLVEARMKVAGRMEDLLRQNNYIP